MRAVPPRLTFAHGFTLTEMAMVLFIIALLLGSLMLPLNAQNDLRNAQETVKALNEARDALVGFAAANGRLPCPATALSNGREDPDGGGICTPFNAGEPAPVGFLPAATLGLAPTDNQGRLLDGWGNPIRYGVTVANNSAFTSANGMATVGMANLVPDLIVCPTGFLAGNLVQNASAPNADCPVGVSAITNNAVAVLYSLGPNAAVGGAGLDETNNPNPNPAALFADRVFISHERTAVGSANGEFDDIVVWLSPNILFNRMIAAGRLP